MHIFMLSTMRARSLLPDQKWVQKESMLVLPDACCIRDSTWDLYQKNLLDLPSMNSGKLETDSEESLLKYHTCNSVYDCEFGLL